MGYTAKKRTEDHREEPKEDHITGDPDEDPREGSDGWPKDPKEDPITEKPQDNFITEDPALYKFRNSRRWCYVKKVTCNFIKKEALAQVFSCEFCEYSRNTSFPVDT